MIIASQLSGRRNKSKRCSGIVTLNANASTHAHKRRKKDIFTSKHAGAPGSMTALRVDYSRCSWAFPSWNVDDTDGVFYNATAAF